MFYLGSEGGQRMKILMIESNDLITQQLSEYLNQLGQQDLSVNKDISSLDLDEAHHYDVIFIDYSVRHEDPFELAYRLKQANPDTYIVFLTRFKNNEAEVFENYDIEYILKPINFYRLKNVIEKAKRYKYKPIERFVGDVSVKMFGNMEVKMNCRNVRFMRRRHKEILAYLILNDFSSTIEEMAQAIMNDREEIYAVHELKALIYELRKDIEIIDRYVHIELLDHKYRLVFDDVKVDYLNFMKVDASKTSNHRIELALISYGKGLLYNFRNEWHDSWALRAKRHFFSLQHSLIHDLEKNKDVDKLRNILFNLKQYLETEEDWDYFNHVVKHNFPKANQEHFLQAE